MPFCKIYNPLLINTSEAGIQYEENVFLTKESLLSKWNDNVIPISEATDLWKTDWWPQRNFSVGNHQVLLRRNKSVKSFMDLQVYYVLAHEKVSISDRSYHSLIRDVSNNRFFMLEKGMRSVVTALTSNFDNIITDCPFTLANVENAISVNKFFVSSTTRADMLTVESCVKKVRRDRILALEGTTLVLLLSNAVLASLLVGLTNNKRNCACTLINTKRHTR